MCDVHLCDVIVEMNIWSSGDWLFGQLLSQTVFSLPYRSTVLYTVEASRQSSIGGLYFDMCLSRVLGMCTFILCDQDMILCPVLQQY